MTTKKLQVALDLFSLEDALSVLREVRDYVDIIELGTPLMIAEGACAVSVVKACCPEKMVFADIKVMDAGDVVPRSVVEAGCDMFSVLCVSDDTTLETAIAYAHEHDALVLADMCNVSDLAARAAQVDSMGADYLCCHVGYGRQADGANPIEELQQLAGAKTPKAIAGGINLSTFSQAVESDAEIIICGGSIVNAEDRRRAARTMREILDAYNEKAAE